MTLEIGSVVEGIITGITNFGAFVELPEGKVGLVHISEVADTYVEDVRRFLKEKDKIKVKILAVNDKGKYDLSIKQASMEGSQPVAPPHHHKSKKPAHTPDNGNSHFENMMQRFLKESEERLLDLKRNTESKIGRAKSR
jgi:S1 RNA binding domain protein